MKLSEAINKDLASSRVFVSYANRETIRIWNSMRAVGDPPLFCGWYWACGFQEGGPFRCESAAMRDAWYRVCKKMQPPLIGTLPGVRTARTSWPNVVQMRR